MDVLELLKQRTSYQLLAKEDDEWVSDLVNSSEVNVPIITTEFSLRTNKLNKERINSFFENYRLKAMFDLQNPYANSNVKMFLYIFTRERCLRIKYGIYKRYLKNKSKKTGEKGNLLMPNEYPDTYFKYLDNIEKFINCNACPDDTDYQEFGYIKAELWDSNVWNPNRYNKQVLHIQKSLSKEKTVHLSEVASIISPRRVGNEKILNSCLTAANFTYPIDYSKLKDGYKTNYTLQKGDIIFVNKDRLFLLYENPPTEIYSSQMAYIIRPNNISPEYLYLYLKSETMQIILQSVQRGCAVIRTNRKGIEEIPVILPRENTENYKKIFYAQSFMPKSMSDYDELVSKLKISDSKAIEGILNIELVDKLKMYKSDVLEKFLKEDIKELNTCFEHKAYKATLILAGSILEAVLIDWLSEIYGKNYFKVVLMNSNGREANLIDYINKIKGLKKPHWYHEAEKANEIRKSRNLVHAKLCLKEKTEINEDLCKEVIRYLIDVIKSRNSTKTIK